MRNKSDERFHRWSLAVAWTVLIYATLYIARPISDFLRQFPWYSFSINGLIITCIVLAVVRLFRNGPARKLSSYVLLVLAVSGYGYGMITLSIPEERLHFIEYGVLAYLLHRALLMDWGRAPAYGWALVLATLIGAGDEGIQYLLPNRYFQFSDICLNSASAALGLILVFAGRQGKHNAL